MLVSACSPISRNIFDFVTFSHRSLISHWADQKANLLLKLRKMSCRVVQGLWPSWPAVWCCCSLRPEVCSCPTPSTTSSSLKGEYAIRTARQEVMRLFIRHVGSAHGVYMALCLLYLVCVYVPVFIHLHTYYVDAVVLSSVVYVY